MRVKGEGGSLGQCSFRRARERVYVTRVSPVHMHVACVGACPCTCIDACVVGAGAQHKCTVLNNRQVRIPSQWVRLLSSAKSFVYAIIALCVDVCARFACSMQACSGLGSRQQAGDMRRGTRRLNLLFSLSSLSDVNCLKSSILGEREGGGRGGRG